MAIVQTEPRGVPIHRDLRTDVQQLLEGFQRALIAGDGEAISRMFETPALVISSEAVVALDTPSKVAALFGAAASHYRARGIVDTRADLIDLEKIGERLLIATVRWPHLDASHHEIGAEESDYTLRRDESGALRFRGVLMRGIEAPLPASTRPKPKA